MIPMVAVLIEHEEPLEGEPGAEVGDGHGGGGAGGGGPAATGQLLVIHVRQAGQAASGEEQVNQGKLGNTWKEKKMVWLHLFLSGLILPRGSRGSPGTRLDGLPNPGLGGGSPF